MPWELLLFTGVANYDMMIIGEVLESTDGLGVFVRPDSPIAQATGYNPSYPNVLGSPETVKGITMLLPIGTAQHFTALNGWKNSVLALLMSILSTWILPRHIRRSKPNSVMPFP